MTDIEVSAMAKRGKEDIPAWIAGLAEDDATYGRDSKSNPVNVGPVSPACFAGDCSACYLPPGVCTCGCHRRNDE